MASLNCMQAPTASTITITRDVNGNVATESAVVGVTAQSFISKMKRRRYSKLEMVLAALSLFLLLTLIIVAVVMGTQKREETNPDDESMKKNEGPIKALARVLSNMDRSVDPCADFYQYACGGWEKRNFIDVSDPSTFPFIRVLAESKRRLREILENIKIKSNYSDKPAILKVFEAYQSCMNSTAVEAFGEEELRRLLVQLVDFNITKKRTSFEWPESVVKIKRRLDLDAFFKLQVWDDLKDSSLRRITMQAVQFPLHHLYYAAQEFTPEAERARYDYVQLMTDVMMLVTASGNRENVTNEMRKVLDLETSIARTQLAPSQRRNYSLINNFVSIKKLSNLTAKFDWLSFFRNLTSDAGYSITPRELLLITSPKMVQNILITLNQTEPSVISNYLAWRIVYSLINILPSKYTKVYREYRGGQITSTWDTCIQDISTTLPLETSILFGQHALTKGTWKEARKIMRNVRDTLIKIIPKQSWMDERTQKSAIDKAEAMIFHFAYPNNLTTAVASLSDAPSKFTVSNVSYFTTYLNVKSFTFMKSFKSLKTTVDRNEYEEDDPMRPTAYFYQTRNKVGVAVSFLHSQLFSLENYKSTNFGVFGMVIGHELSHAFDLFGHRFDGNGKQRSWMSRNSTEKIFKTTSCLGDSYSRLTHNGHKLRKTGSYTEAYADTGGIKLAFEAYKAWMNKYGEEDILPGVDITHNQLFFLSYAQLWCSKYKDPEVSRLIHTGILPFPFRVQGTVMNSKEFADAFSCARDTAMNPQQKKCEVWETF